jgi:OOP family OmpA-OmpF porin
MKTNVMLLTALLAGACTKTIVLKETTPVAITAQRQAQAPEPEPEPPRVEVKQDRIEVNDTIQFDFNKATIRSDSFGLLDEIAKVIGEHPEIAKIRIEGHTDSVGGKAYNLTLSKKRAASVNAYLVKKGIAASRLISEGYGLEQPISDNDSEEGRAKNRRVAFKILERTETAPGGGA